MTTQKTIYERVEEKELDINTSRKNAEYLQQRGFEVKGDYPILRQEAERMLQDPTYDTNSVVQEMRGGRRLRDIVTEIIDRRYFNLKFPWKKEERAEYNQRINYLNEITTAGYKLKRRSILAFCEDSPTTASIYNGILYSILSGGIVSLSGSKSIDIESTNLFFGLLGCLLGIGIFGLNPNTNKRLRTDSRLNSEIQYLDEVLGRK